MGFGQTLRSAREAKGYTTAQLADITHIYVKTIEGLEAEDFREIPAPIYGRGFVKLCCQTLDIDPKPLIDEFMELYNGENTEPQPTVPPTTSDSPAAPVEPPAAMETPAARPPLDDLFNRPEEPSRTATSRFAPPQPQEETGYRIPFSLPAIPWRLVFLILGAIAIVWAVVAGGSMLYRALSSHEPAPAANQTADRGKTDAAAQPRVPKTVKPLYID